MVHRFEEMGVEVAVDHLWIVEADSWWLEVAGDEPSRVFERLSVVSAARAECLHEADAQPASRPANALCVVGGGRRGVPEDDGQERPDIHPQLEGG